MTEGPFIKVRTATGEKLLNIAYVREVNYIETPPELEAVMADGTHYSTTVEREIDAIRFLLESYRGRINDLDAYDLTLPLDRD